MLYSLLFLLAFENKLHGPALFVVRNEWLRSRNVSQTGGEGVRLDLWTLVVLNLQTSYVKTRAASSASDGSLCICHKA